MPAPTSQALDEELMLEIRMSSAPSSAPTSAFPSAPYESAQSLSTEYHGHGGLLTLPDSLLEAILLCFYTEDDSDERSLLNAAMAHSRLRTASLQLLRDFRATVTQQQQADSIMNFMSKHSDGVDSIQLYCDESNPLTFVLHQNLQLSSLDMRDVKVRLHPGHGFQGVLGPGDSLLNRLGLFDCELLDGAAEALSQLPADLEDLHLLDVITVAGSTHEPVKFPTHVLQQLQQLKYLELAGMKLQCLDKVSPPLQPLQYLTKLADLRLSADSEGWLFDSADDADDDTSEADPDDHIIRISASMLANTQHLTQLELTGYVCEPGALAGKTHLQHLELRICLIAGGAEGAAQLALHLQELQQLTHLTLHDSLHYKWASPAAYSALTASSNLQELDIGKCNAPAGMWQHIFNKGAKLEQLQSLIIRQVMDCDFPEDKTPAPDIKHLSCCTGLTTLDMCGLVCDAEVLAPLKRLSGLRALGMTIDFIGQDAMLAMEAVSQCTQLNELGLSITNLAEGQLGQATLSVLLVQLNQLTALTLLAFNAHDTTGDMVQSRVLSFDDPDAEPVWIQLLNHINDMEEATLLQETQQAAAALAGQPHD